MISYIKFLREECLKDGLKKRTSHIVHDKDGYNIDQLNVTIYINKLSHLIFT